MIQYQPAPKILPAVAALGCMRSIEKSMAEVIREMAFSGETVSAETLKQRGYSEATVKRFGQAAVNEARRKSVRRVEQG